MLDTLISYDSLMYKEERGLILVANNYKTYLERFLISKIDLEMNRLKTCKSQTSRAPKSTDFLGLTLLSVHAAFLYYIKASTSCVVCYTNKEKLYTGGCELICTGFFRTVGVRV